MKIEQLREERQAYLTFLKYISAHNKKSPIKITIEFKDHRFKDRLGFATISQSSSYHPRMQNIVNAIEDAVERDLDDILKEIRTINPTFDYFEKKDDSN
jgi:hypothetical protein